MRSSKYHEITGKDLVFLNPSSADKLDRLVELMDLPEGARVLDVGSGKGEALLRAAMHQKITGIGVDLSPDFTRVARERAAAIGEPGRNLQFLAMRGEDYVPEGLCDAVLCIGASWIFGGMKGTAAQLSEYVKPGGYLAIGEPHLIEQPTADYLAELAAAGSEPDSAMTLAENLLEAESCGIVALYVIPSSQADYDHYEWSRIRAAELYALANPDDPDVPALLKRARTHRDLYLRYARETVGWALYLFKKP